MAKLNGEFFDKIAAKVIKEGKPDDLAKFMLSGGEHIAAVQRYFDFLEADEKKQLTLRDDKWFLGPWYDAEDKMHTGLPLFKLIASSIIPFVEDLSIINTHLEDYSFLKDIENLEELWLEFADDEYIKVLSALSSLQSVNFLYLNFKGFNLELLSTLTFSFNNLEAKNFIFEADPKCDKVFQPDKVSFFGDEELKNDFVFSRENYQNYVAIFPNARRFYFEFYIKVVDDMSALIEVSNVNHLDEADVLNETIEVKYCFFDYSGHPDSKVLKMLQDKEDWNTEDCPFREAYIPGNDVDVSCSFPLAIADIGNRLAEQSLRRIPEGSNGKPEDYYRLTIENEWGHTAEFEVLKSLLAEDMRKAYCAITGMNHERLWFVVNFHIITEDGTVADKFKNGDAIFVEFQ